MKIQRILLAALTLSPALAFAHHGPEVSELHLHVGNQAASSSVDLRLVCAGLVLGLAYQAFRHFKRN